MSPAVSTLCSRHCLRSMQIGFATADSLRASACMLTKDIQKFTLRCFSTCTPRQQMPPPPICTRPSHTLLDHTKTGVRDDVFRKGIPLRERGRGELVYKAPMAKFIKFVKMFSVASSATGAAVYPVVAHHFNTLPAFLQTVMYTMYAVSVFMTPILMHFMFKGYVVRMYYDTTRNEDRFTFITYNILGLRKLREFYPLTARFPEQATALSNLIVTDNDNSKPVPLFVNFDLIEDANARARLFGRELSKPVPGFEGKTTEDWEAVIRSLPREKVSSTDR